MLKIANLTVKRTDRTILKDVNLVLEAGVGHGLVGVNGSGKTTLMAAVLGVLPFLGSVDRNYTPHMLGVIWQDRGLPLNVSVRDWLKYLSDLYQSPVDDDLLKRFGVDLSARPIRTLSGGQQQKIAVVSAFFHKPKMLILDEPTVALDEESRMNFIDLCSERMKNGSTVLLSSHNPNDVAGVATSITNLELLK